MRSGQLRHSITIQARSAARDAFGGASDQWADVFPNALAASIEPLSGRELYSAQQHHPDVSVRIRIRHRVGVLAEQRVIFKGQAYSVLYVIPKDMANRELHLMCSIGVNEG